MWWLFTLGMSTESDKTLFSGCVIFICMCERDYRRFCRAARQHGVSARRGGESGRYPAEIRSRTVRAAVVVVVVALSVLVAAGSAAAAENGGEFGNQSVGEISAVESETHLDRWELDDGGVDPSLADASGEVTALVVLDEQFRLPETGGDIETLKSATADRQEPVQSELSAIEGVTVTQSFWLVNVLEVTVDTDRIDPTTVETLRGVHSVVRPQPIEPPEPPEPPAVGVDAPGDESTYGLELLGVPEAWDSFDTQGEGTTVAVIDDGVDPNHPDIDVEKGVVLNGSGPVDAPMTPETGHGMHTSATATGGNASGTAVGVAPGADLYHVDVFSETEGFDQISALIRSVEWSAEQGVDVASMSIGAPGFYIMELIPLVGNANALGTSVVTSAGNDGESPVLNTVPSPANDFNAMTVGAVDESEDVAEFSSGGVVESDAFVRSETRQALGWPDRFTVPDVAAPGVDVYSAWLDGGYAELSGTSMAAPHVAGAVALVQSATDERLSPDTIEAALRASADRPADADVPDRGPGYPQQDIRYGTGVIDVPAAIEMAQSAETVRGTVTNSSGPVPGADVWSAGTHVGTTDDGVYTLPVVPDDGLLDVTVEQFGHEPETVSVPVDEMARPQAGDHGNDTGGTTPDDIEEESGDELEIVEMDPTDITVERGTLVAMSVTVENVGSEQGPVREVTYSVDGETVAHRNFNPGPGETDSRIVGFYNTGPLEPGVYTHAVSTPDDTHTANLTVEPAEHTADVDLTETVDVRERTAFGPAQPAFVATQDSFDVPLEVANLETYTPTLGPNSTVDPEHLTVVVEGEEYDIGESIGFDDRDSSLTVTVEVGFFADPGDQVELTHELAGAGGETALTTGPTEVDETVSPPQFEVSDLAANETLVLDDGELLVASATVTNTGQRQDYQQIDFVAEYEDRFDISVEGVDVPLLAPGESTTVELVAAAPTSIATPGVVEHGFRTGNDTSTREAFYLEPDTSRVEVETFAPEATVEPGTPVTLNATTVNLGTEQRVATTALRFAGETVTQVNRSLAPGTRGTIEGTVEGQSVGQYLAEAVAPAETASRLVGVGTTPVPRNVTVLHTQGGLDTPEMLALDGRYNVRTESYLNIENEQVTIEEVLAASDVVVAHDMLDTDRAHDFVTALAEDPTTGAVYLEQAGEGLHNSDAISVRSAALGVPEGVTDDPDAAQPVAYGVESEHPLFEGVADPGETIPLYDDLGTEPLAGFELSQGDPLATVAGGGGDGDPAAWVDPDSGGVLLAAIAPIAGLGEGVDAANYTDEAGTVFENAVEYASDQRSVLADLDIAGQGQNASLLWGAGGNATVSVTGGYGDLAGETAVTLSVADTSGAVYTATETVDLEVGTTTQATFENISEQPPAGTDAYEVVVGVEGVGETVTGTLELDVDVTGDGNPATDTTGDGLLNDISGDGEFTIADVQVLFEHLGDEVIQHNAGVFDFSEASDDTEVSIFDVQALFNRLRETGS